MTSESLIPTLFERTVLFENCRCKIIVMIVLLLFIIKYKQKHCLAQMKLVLTSASLTEIIINKKESIYKYSISAAKIHHQEQIGGKWPFMLIFSNNLDKINL